MFNYWTPVDKAPISTVASSKDNKPCESANTSMDLTEIEQNLKKEILDESGYASDFHNDHLQPLNDDVLSSLLDEEIEIKLDSEIGEQIMEQKWQNRLKIFDEIT